MNYMQLLQLRRHPDPGTGGGPAGGGDATGQEAQQAQGTEGETGAPEGQEAGKEGAPRTFTQAEVDAIVAKRLARQKPKDDNAGGGTPAGGAQQALNLPEVLKQAQQLAAMKPEEQVQYLQNQQMQQQSQAHEQVQAELARLKLEVSARDTLAELKLPAELLPLVNLTSEEACAASIKALQSVIPAQVKAMSDASVKELTSGKTPPAGQPNKALDIDLDAIFGVKKT